LVVLSLPHDYVNIIFHSMQSVNRNYFLYNPGIP